MEAGGGTVLHICVCECVPVCLCVYVYSGLCFAKKALGVSPETVVGSRMVCDAYTGGACLSPTTAGKTLFDSGVSVLTGSFLLLFFRGSNQ